MSVCGMPQITRFLGPVVTIQSGRKPARARATYSVTTNLLKQIDSFDHVEMTIGTDAGNLAPFLARGYEVRVNPTLLLDCRRNPNELWADLRDKVRNVIRRARDCLIVFPIADVKVFVDFYKENLEEEESYFDLSVVAPCYIAAHAKQQSKIIAAVDQNGTPHAMVLFVWDDSSVYYFLSSRNKNVAHVGAVSLLVWTGIEFAHSRGLWFDFDGGIVNDARYKFLAAFGGEVANRFDVTRSTRHFRVQRTFRKIPPALIRRLSPRRMKKAEASRPKTL